MPVRAFDIQRIDHIVLRIRDLDASLAFYCGVLGCTVERRLDDIGLIQLRAGEALIDLVPIDGKLGRAGGAPPGTDGRNVDHICLRIAPFDAADLTAYLTEMCVSLPEEGIVTRYGAEGEGPSLYIGDPDGNVVELKGPPSDKAEPPR
ncbi:MAG: VOC family protein [Pseudomonadota bacterium]|nr:VOC family protein [Pseudomonadota bacterium]